MRKLFLLILVFVCSVAFGQGEVVKKGLKVVTRNAKILKAHYPWEYNEPSDWINIHYCPKDEILMLFNDLGDRYISFSCNIGGDSMVFEMYGGIKGDSLINKQKIGRTKLYTYQIPIGKGKPCSLGYTTYKLRLYANNNIYPLLSLVSFKHPSSSLTNSNSLLLNINSTNLTSISLGEINTGVKLTRLKYVNLYNCPNLVTLSNCFAWANSLENITFAKTLDNLVNCNAVLAYCTSLKKVVLPKYLNNVTSFISLFYNCENIEYVEMPIEMNNVIEVSGEQATRFLFNNNYKLKKIQYPLSMYKNTLITGCNYNNTNIEEIRFPRIMPNTKSLLNCFYNNYKLKEIYLSESMNKVTTMYGMIYNDTSLQKLILPDSMIICTDMNNWVNVWNLDSISTCVFGNVQIVVGIIMRDLKTFKQPTLKTSRLLIRGASLATASALHTIDIDWANSTYGGTSPQIDIRWNSLSATTIDAIFTALPVVVGKTINVNGNPGSATCTPSIATAKGWTVII